MSTRKAPSLEAALGEAICQLRRAADFGWLQGPEIYSVGHEDHPNLAAPVMKVGFSGSDCDWMAKYLCAG